MVRVATSRTRLALRPSTSCAANAIPHCENSPRCWRRGLEALPRRGMMRPAEQEDTMAYETILYDVKDRIGTITLNRPDRLNAYNDRMASDIRKAMAEAANDTAVRVIILTGAGRGFCAGADMQV